MPIKIELNPNERRELEHIAKMVDARNTLSKMAEDLFDSELKQQIARLLGVLDAEIRDQTKEFFAKAVQSHYAELMDIFWEALKASRGA